MTAAAPQLRLSRLRTATEFEFPDGVKIPPAVKKANDAVGARTASYKEAQRR